LIICWRSTLAVISSEPVEDQEQLAHPVELLESGVAGQGISCLRKKNSEKRDSTLTAFV
jgi:hypothetical protein